MALERRTEIMKCLLEELLQLCTVVVLWWCCGGRAGWGTAGSSLESWVLSYIKRLHQSLTLRAVSTLGGCACWEQIETLTFLVAFPSYIHSTSG